MRGAERLGALYLFVEEGCLVVSGIARGIDTAAHPAVVATVLLELELTRRLLRQADKRVSPALL